MSSGTTLVTAQPAARVFLVQIMRVDEGLLLQLSVRVVCTACCSRSAMSSRLASEFQEVCLPHYFAAYIDLLDQGAVAAYVISVFFTMTTITTIGYGNIVAVTAAEQLVNMLIMLVGVICECNLLAELMR